MKLAFLLLLSVSAFAEDLTWHGREGVEKYFQVAGAYVDFRPERGRRVRPAVRFFDSGPRMATTFPSGLSPVYSDSPAGGNRRALPGGMVVQFSEKLSRQEVLRRIGLESAARPLGGQEPAIAWWVETAPGLASVQAAQRVQSREQIVSAEPDWWLEVSPR
ncbi:hypothetical protein K2X33_06145 [bacterium]|nr:hypothetical protein [bacterium]